MTGIPPGMPVMPRNANRNKKPLYGNPYSGLFLTYFFAAMAACAAASRAIGTRNGEQLT